MLSVGDVTLPGRPARSPDLNLLDFWFWGMLKTKIYHYSTLHSLEHLQQLFTEACSSLTTENYACAVTNLLRRLDLLEEANGNNFDQYLYCFKILFYHWLLCLKCFEMIQAYHVLIVILK